MIKVSRQWFPDLGLPRPEASIGGGQFRPLHRALQNAELMAESQDLHLKRGVAGGTMHTKAANE